MHAESVMLTVADALDRSAINFMLVDSFASNFYGIVRSTQDADFLLQVDELPAAVLAKALGSEFTLDPQASLETFTFGTYYTILHRDSDFVVDLFLLKNDPHDQLSFSRRKMASYGGGQFFVPAPEDVIISKLRWSQGGRRYKDVDDARNVLDVQSPINLDLPYIRHWTDQHGTRSLFEQLLTDSLSAPC